MALTSPSAPKAIAPQGLRGGLAGTGTLWSPASCLFPSYTVHQYSHHERWELRSLNQSAPPFLPWYSFPITWGHGRDEAVHVYPGLESQHVTCILADTGREQRKQQFSRHPLMAVKSVLYNTRIWHL